MSYIANTILTMKAEGFNLKLEVTHGGEYWTAKLVDVDASLTDGPLFAQDGNTLLEGRDESMSDAIAELDSICRIRPDAEF